MGCAIVVDTYWYCGGEGRICAGEIAQAQALVWGLEKDEKKAPQYVNDNERKRKKKQGKEEMRNHKTIDREDYH